MTPGFRLLVSAVLLLSLFTGAIGFAQTTISTGSIQGTVTDPSGAVVGSAKVTITNISTGRVINVTSTSAGAYTSGALTPGNYTVRVEASGFKTSQISHHASQEIPLTNQVGFLRGRVGI